MANTKKETATMGFKARKNGTTNNSIVKTKAVEAIEGAVCYLQEQLSTDGIKLNDDEALTAIRLAARTTRRLWAQA